MAGSWSNYLGYGRVKCEKDHCEYICNLLTLMQLLLVITVVCWPPSIESFLHLSTCFIFQHQWGLCGSTVCRAPLPSIVVLGHIACEILGPQAGIKLAPPVVEAWSFNSWTAREVPCCPLLKVQCKLGLNFLFSPFKCWRCLLHSIT